MFLAYFALLKYLLILPYFNNSLFTRKSVLKLTQVSIKISKISYFSFTSKLIEKKKLVWRVGITRKFLLEVGFIFLMEIGKFQKRVVTLKETIAQIKQ